MDTDEYTYLWDRRYQLKVRVLMNRMYQQERQRIFEFREGAVKAISIIAGSIAFANIANTSIIKWCAFFLTGLNIMSLVFSYGTKSRDAGKRSSDWALLERDIDAKGERDFGEGEINSWYARANEIEAGEPSPHIRLLDRCHERACLALGGNYDSTLNKLTRTLPVICLP